jgi:putative phosphoribosyl transferase
MKKFITSYKNQLFMYKYIDRVHAGKVLAEMITTVHGKIFNATVLAIPNGGIPVGIQIAEKLNAPLDMMIVRKLPIPYEPEAGFGAISADGEIVLNDSIVARIGLRDNEINQISARVIAEIKKRLKEYKGTTQPVYNLKDRFVFMVDDGLASGYTMLAAVRTVRRYNPERIVIAVPTASKSAYVLLQHEVDGIICPDVRAGMFFAVADAYKNWYDLSANEVKHMLSKASVFHRACDKNHSQI